MFVKYYINLQKINKGFFSFQVCANIYIKDQLYQVSQVTVDLNIYNI